MVKLSCTYTEKQDALPRTQFVLEQFWVGFEHYEGLFDSFLGVLISCYILEPYRWLVLKNTIFKLCFQLHVVLVAHFVE